MDTCEWIHFFTLFNKILQKYTHLFFDFQVELYIFAFVRHDHYGKDSKTRGYQKLDEV